MAGMGRSAAVLAAGFPVLPGRHAVKGAEGAGKVLGRGVAHFQGDLFNGFVGIGQQDL